MPKSHLKLDAGGHSGHQKPATCKHAPWDEEWQTELGLKLLYHNILCYVSGGHGSGSRLMAAQMSAFGLKGLEREYHQIKCSSEE